jgi:hypothetical protein
VSFGQNEIFAQVRLWRINPPFTTLPGQQKYALLREEQTAGTEGGTFTSGDWRTRTLNTTVVDEVGITLASNQFTLPAGTYRFNSAAPGHQTSRQQTRLRNITDSTNVTSGESGFTDETNDSTVAWSRSKGQFSITSAKVFELQHQCSVTQTTNGLGVAANFGITEIYSSIELLKIA